MQVSQATFAQHQPQAAVTRLPALGAVQAADHYLDLSRQSRDVLGRLDGLNDAELDSFLHMIATLVKQGIIGVETLEVRGEPYQSFITTRIGAPELRGARPWRGPDRTGRPLDLRA